MSLNPDSTQPDQILSASRRTDIPAFYLDWFMDRIRSGCFEVRHPYTRQTKTVAVSRESFHSIVFWSKNYGPFLNSGAGQKLQGLGFNLFFQFTLNSACPLLEPGLPPLDLRLDQMRRLADEFGPDAVSWRFDPICFFRTGETEQTNLADFMQISGHAAQNRIRTCVTSFLDLYPKILKRLNRVSARTGINLCFFEPDLETRIRVIRWMENHLAGLGMTLSLCCEKNLHACLGKDSRVQENACINGNLLRQVFGGRPESSRDRGQRSSRGCRCTRSVDVGSYTDHPCHHNCLFCYAAPGMDQTAKRPEPR